MINDIDERWVVELFNLLFTLLPTCACELFIDLRNIIDLHEFIDLHNLEIDLLTTESTCMLLNCMNLINISIMHVLGHLQTCELKVIDELHYK